MKISVTKDDLASGLQAVQNVVGARSTLPILSNVLLVAVRRKQKSQSLARDRGNFMKFRENRGIRIYSISVSLTKIFIEIYVNFQIRIGPGVLYSCTRT